MEGPQWTTGSIGRRCKPGNGLSRPVLIGRHEPHTHTHPRTPARARAPGRAANQTTRVHYAAQNQPTPPPPRGPTTTAHHTPPPSRRPQRAGKRPEPYRTRKLSPPAPMVLPPPGSGRVGHHRNTHQPTGPRGAGAPTRRPPHAGRPTPAGQTHKHTLYNTTKVIQRAHGGARTTCVALDHGGPTLVLECGMRIPASGAQRRRAPRSARSSGNSRARHLTREIVT